MFDVLVIGGVGVDTIVRVPSLAVPPGDSLTVGPILDYVAHSGNGVALGFHALGLRTKLVDLLGDDAQGALVLARYAAAGLDFTHLPAPHGTPRAVNLVDDAGRRFSFFDGRHPPGTTVPPEFYLPFLERAKHVHVATHRARTAFDHARERGITTSTDIHAWDGVSPGPMEFAAQADLVFLSSEAAGERVDDLMFAIQDKGMAQAVVATAGAAGCRVLTRQDPQIRRYPAVAPPRPVVDSNGAGDAFSTAFMSRWFARRPVAECALAGAASGAFACCAAGTHAELMTESQLAEAMTTHGSAWPAASP